MSEKPVTTPFKTMDIKAAFLAAGNRKRKASSPTSIKTQTKSIKLSNDENEEGLEIISEDNDGIAIGDCKENKDLNSLPNIPQVNDISPCETLNPEDKKSLSAEINESKSQTSGDEDSLKASSDELNSTLNDSVNVLQTSELSESIENQDKSEIDMNSSIDTKEVTSESNPKKNKVENQNDSRPKKKRKMTPEEAIARANEREEKQKILLLKKQELEAQKLERKKTKERRQIEKELRLKEKERERMEKEEERKEKERLKQEKKDQEEKERLQKLKEKEERKKQQQMMLEMKQEEKKKKEEQRLKREEEMKMAEEEKQKAKLEKEQKEKERKEKAKAHFMKFFKKEDVAAPPVPQPIEKEGAFKPFQVSDNMVLAHVVQPAAQERFNKKHLDQALKSQDIKELYLQVLKSGYKDVRQRKRLRKPKTCESDVIIVDKSEQSELCFTAKLLQFSENVRPPYWGTWRKQSKKISPRNPFAQEDMFDYSVDSDDEWDEGGPGESLSGTENELESEDDYEVDNEFFVPHGYLSAEEEKEEEEDEVTNDPEKQKAVLKLKQQEFESERKKKTTELKPIILGSYFENGSGLQDEGLRTFLNTYACEVLIETPIQTCFTVKKIQADSKISSNVNSPSTGTPGSKKLKLVPEEAMPHLIRLLHGNVNSRDTIIKEFQAFWQQHSHTTSPVHDSPKAAENSTETVETNPNNPEAPPENNAPDSTIISKRQLSLIIKKVSAYGKCPNPVLKKSCWWVNDDVREKYGLLDVPIPNEWNYITSKEEVEASPIVKKDTASIKEFLHP